VKLLQLLFRLGVLFAVFEFIWGIFRLIFMLIRGSKVKKSGVESYAIRFLQYFFLVDVTFLFCLKQQSSSQIEPFELTIGALVLLLYIVGKLQKRQNRLSMMQGVQDQFSFLKIEFNLFAEIALIFFTACVFIFLGFYPYFAHNPVSNWFYDSILSIQSTPIFGFIFNIIGFFVLLGFISKFVNTISFLLSGKPFVTTKLNVTNSTGNPNKFDDFEDVSDD